MASKLTLISISSGFKGTDIETNFTSIEDEFDKCLYRDGTSPNQMEATIDMNSYKIQNLGAPALNQDAARLQDILSEQTSINDVTAITLGSDNYADLKALKPASLNNDDVRYVRGRSSVGDGGEGHFRWDSSDLSTEVTNDSNMALYVPPDSAPDGSNGAWVKQSGVVDRTVTVPVGAGARFSTLNQALEYLSGFKSSVLASQGPPVVINLLSGFIMSEQVLISGIDLSWIKITADDAEVTIERTALTEGLTSGASRYPAFGAINNGHLPMLDALFSMDESGSVGLQLGVYISEGSSGSANSSAGVKNSGHMNLRVERQSWFVGRGTVWTGAKSGTTDARCVLITEGGRADLSQADVSGSESDDNLRLSNNAYLRGDEITSNNATQAGIRVTFGSTASLRGATANNNGTQGITAEDASNVYAAQATATGNTISGVRVVTASSLDFDGGDADDNGQGITVSEGSTCSATGATARNATGTNWGVMAQSGGVLNFSGGDASGGTNVSYGIGARTGGKVNAENANGQKGASTDNEDIRNDSGGIIVAHGATGGLARTPNTVTEDGIVFQA